MTENIDFYIFYYENVAIHFSYSGNMYIFSGEDGAYVVKIPFEHMQKAIDGYIRAKNWINGGKFK